MKRLIVISVVFALVAGAAFAVDVGGEVIGAVNVISKDGAADDATVFTGGLGRIRLEGSGDADIGVGTIGGWLRAEAASAASFALNDEVLEGTYDPTDPDSDDPFSFSGGGGGFAGLAWWKPIDQLKIQIGGNPDGHYDTSHIGRYGFYAQANEIGLVNGDGNWGATSFDKGVFGGGFGYNHFALIIDPIEGLNINVALPLNAEAVDPDDKQIGATFKGALFQVNYSADFGAIHVTYAGAGSSLSDIGKIWGSVYLGSLVDGLGLELGLGYSLKKADMGKDPLGVALGVRYDAGAFGIKLRTILEAGGETAAGDKQDVAVRVDLLPSYAVSDDVSIFADIGIYLSGAEEQFAWHLAPYVRIGPEWGPGFYAGLKFDNGGGVKDEKVNVAIPVGIIAKF
jgi:hypothetical protein